MNFNYYPLTSCNKGFKQTCRLTIYYSLDRSILGYTWVMWSPCYSVHLDNIEKVQRRALKILSSKCGHMRRLASYCEVLEEF